MNLRHQRLHSITHRRSTERKVDCSRNKGNRVQTELKTEEVVSQVYFFRCDRRMAEDKGANEHQNTSVMGGKQSKRNEGERKC